MKHSCEDARGVAPDPPDFARDCFGKYLDKAQRYAEWLVGAGAERGIIGPREGERIWERHLVNSAALSQFISPGSTVIDIGSGGGLPGVVIAIVQPTTKVTLLEPMKRRVEFLELVTADLELKNTSVVRGRAEELSSTASTRFDVATARAVAPLDRLAAWAVPLLHTEGRLLALKGATARQELEEAAVTLDRLGISQRRVHPVEVAGTVTHVIDLPVDANTNRRAARRTR